MVSTNLSIVVSVIALLVAAGGITYASIRLGDIDSVNSNLVSKVNSISSDVTSLKSQIGQLGQQQADRLKAVEAELAERKAREALIDAARKEGKVTIYTSQTIEQMEALKKRFEATYPGITMEFIRALGGPLTERLQTEFAANKRVGDVVQGSQEDFVVYKERGWLEKYLSPELKGIPDIYKDPDGMNVAARIPFYVVGYNTKLVTGVDVPKTWDDVVNPKWKGKFSIGDPFVHPSTLVWFDAMKQVLGNKWANFVTQMRALNPRLQVSLTPVVKQIVTGEVSIGLTLTSSMFPELAAGNPVAVAPVEPLVALPNKIAILKNSPHPNAAKLYFDWFLSDATMKFLAEFGDTVSKGYAPDAYAKYIPSVKYTVRALTERESDALKKEMGLPWN
ncbi:MAG: extracellular solute-binding protein [Thaumarchaeota archaeon]|nr:extracellular solute-binding protein [Nitrososphaerota archaeon]